MSTALYVRFIIGAAALLCVVGCEPVPETQAATLEYQRRLAYVLERDLPAAETIRRINIPDRSATPIAVQPLQLSLLDSLRIDECKLGSLIADRNSSLGRLRAGLRQFHTDRQIASALKTCALRNAELNPELANKLSALGSAKAAQLKALRNNAWLSEPAIDKSLRMGPNVLENFDQKIFSNQLNSLQRLISAQQLTTSLLPNNELEQLLEQLENNNYLSQLWRTLLWYEQQLQRANLIVVGIAEDAGCTSVSVPERAQILRTVFFKFFAAEMQTQLATAIGQAELVSEVLVQLESQLLSTEWIDYLAELRSLPNRLKTLTRIHAEHWQDLFEQCGFSPAQRSHEA